MAGVCSAHRKKEPGCKLCATHPREIFPNWDKKVKEAQAAGTMKCAKCGFEFYLTINMCPKCSAMAQPETILEIKSCNLVLAGELLWFVNEWCKDAGWIAPKMKSTGDTAFTIFAYPPKSNGEPES
jgi:hypothetical protein